MPFTFSHPAIVLPLTFLPQKWFSLTGLVIGSLTPDFEYFFRMKIQSEYSHTLGGLFWFDLPVGIMLAFIFHNFVRDALFSNLPRILKTRIAIFKQFNWNNFFNKHWFIVMISLLIGAASHLLWDSFTHEQGYFAKTIPALMNKVEIFGRPILIFKIIQHSSTIVGAIAIIYALLKLPANMNVKRKINYKYWSVLLVLTMVIISIRLLSGLDYKLYGHVFVTVISAGLIALIITPMIVHQME